MNDLDLDQMIIEKCIFDSVGVDDELDFRCNCLFNLSWFRVIFTWFDYFIWTDFKNLSTTYDER